MFNLKYIQVKASPPLSFYFSGAETKGHGYIEKPSSFELSNQKLLDGYEEKLYSFRPSR